jgi:UDP-2-acetamido-2,6-beta-L-arabino-hexul-4-ose reductase
VKATVTGASGFIGKNLVVALQRAGVDVAPLEIGSSNDAWRAATRGAEVVYHLAGVNRTSDERDFTTGNVDSLRALLDAIDAWSAAEPATARPTIVLSSSVQATQDNAYGRSKLAAEQALEAYATATGTPAVIYRLPGVFGKWCRPYYNSVVATFCHNVARDLPIEISDPAHVVELVHVDDIVAQFLTHLEVRPARAVRATVHPRFSLSLSELAERIRGYRAIRETLLIPDLADPFTYRLFSTYTSYLPPDDLAYTLEQRRDNRGTLAELLRSRHFGQMFVSRTDPGITRGNHYHDMKVEKFCVLAGDAIIRFRSVLAADISEYRISGTEFRVVDIPPGMTHSIENVGHTEMIVLFWASEILDRQRSDTHFVDVLPLAKKG